MRRTIHKVSRVLVACFSLCWVVRFRHFAVGFSWDLQGIENEMSDAASSAGYETWDEVVYLHIAWVTVTLCGCHRIRSNKTRTRHFGSTNNHALTNRCSGPAKSAGR